MVTKRNTKKNKVFSKKNTKKNYYGGEIGAVTGTEKPNWFQVFNENMKKLKKAGIKPDGAKVMNEAKESSGFNEWARQNYNQPTSLAQVKGTVDSDIPPEIKIPSLVNEDLFNKSLASNVDVLIEKSLDMNNFSYFLEKQTQQSQTQQSQTQQSQTQLIYNDIPKAFETSNRVVEPILAFGGGKYFSINSDENKWLNIFKKYKDLIEIFSTTGVENERRNNEIKRFNLYLEMISFYRDVITELGLIEKSIESIRPKTTLLKTINNYYVKINENERRLLGGIIYDRFNFLETFSQISVYDENTERYFVNFVLFNSSINKLFSPYTGPDASKLVHIINPVPPVNVNIFQLSEELTGSTLDINTRLTSDIPLYQMTGKYVNIETYYTQFTTYSWDKDYINQNFFKQGKNTGDNISVLVRSTILYVISKIFNKPNVKRAINDSQDQGTSFKNYREFRRILKENFSYISEGFLSDVAKSFLPSDINFTIQPNLTTEPCEEWKQQLELIQNFLQASTTKEDRNVVSIPYNIFLNLYKRDDTQLYITNIPDNVINTDALKLINDLERLLTFNRSLDEKTLSAMADYKKHEKEEYKKTTNIYNINNNIETENLPLIIVSEHENPNAFENMYTDFGDFTEELKIGDINVNVKKDSITLHNNYLDFNKSLTDSLPDFSGTEARPIPDNCELQTHIHYLNGIDNATIDCQRACLMSQLVYENTKIVRLFNFQECWNRNENLNAEGKGLKYLGPYQPNYQYGAYSHNIIGGGNEIERFNNTNYVYNDKTDNLNLSNYNYVEHKCHVWIDDHLKRVYVVFRGTASTHDWLYTDLAIAQGLGFQEGRLLQIKEILRDIYRQLSSINPRYTSSEDRINYKLIFAGHSLGGFLSIMASAVVFNNKFFNYKNTFQQATSITFNPWFPPEAPDISFTEKPDFLSKIFGSHTVLTGTFNSQGMLDYYVPIINYGNTCAFAFGICNDMAQRTLIPSCSKIVSNLKCTGAKISILGSYANTIKGPFYYYLVKGWSSFGNPAPNHSVNNFYGSFIQKKLCDFSQTHSSLYDDLPENINRETNYLDMLFTKLQSIRVKCKGIPNKPLLECGVRIRSNIIFGSWYRIPIDVPFDDKIIPTLKWFDRRNNLLDVHVVLDELYHDASSPPPGEPFTERPPAGEPLIDHTGDSEWTRYQDENTGYPYWHNSSTGESEWDWKNPTFGGKKYKTVVKKTSKKIRKRCNKRTTKKLRK